MSDLERAKELEIAWYDYCITNRLIAYGEVPELTEEQIEARCKEQLEKDCESESQVPASGNLPVVRLSRHLK